MRDGKDAVSTGGPPRTENPAPRTDKKIAISQECGDFFCVCQKKVVILHPEKCTEN